MYRIATCSNFNLEVFSEKWAVNVTFTDKEIADKVCQLLIENMHPEQSDYYRVVPSDYKLYSFDPNS